MGVAWVLENDELVAAFKRDWQLGIPLREMAAMYGFRNINSVSRAAQRLDLPKRRGGRERVEPLSDGHWVLRRGVRVWCATDRGSPGP